MTTKPAAKKTEKHVSAFSGRYKQGVGGRKTATAQVRLYPQQSGIVINGKDLAAYFPRKSQQMIVNSALEATEMKGSMGVSVRVSGGGMMAQAGAVRHGISRALVAHNEELRKKLKREGFMTRDARVVERKKYGLKKARRAPQWAKR